MPMKQGVLVYNEQEERYQLRFGLEEYSRTFNCGDCMEVKVGEKWIPSRFEMRYPDEWYLVGIKANKVDGLTARIK